MGGMGRKGYQDGIQVITENSKHKIRAKHPGGINSKQTQMTEAQGLNKGLRAKSFEHLIIGNLNLFLISIFGFRIWRVMR